jgi:hypothetical protein
MAPERPMGEQVTSHLNGIRKSVSNAIETDNNTKSAVVNLSGSDILEPEAEKKEKAKPLDSDNQRPTGVEDIKDDSQSSSAPSKKIDVFSETFADATKDDEPLYKAIGNAISSQNYYGKSQSLFNQEKDEDKFDIRAKQAVLHLAWTDARIKEMEKQIKSLRRDVDGLPADFEVKKTSRQPVYQHELKRSTASEFRLNDDSKTVPNNERPAVEVLITDHTAPRLSKSVTNESIVQVSEISDATDPKIVPLRRSETEGVLQIPERLRIRSRALLALLGRITGEELLGNGFTRNIEHPAPVVFLRPFKLFVSYEKEIKAEVRELELKIEKEAELNANAPQVPGSKKELPDFKNEDLLADLNLLVEFLDYDLRPTFELRRKIKEGTATHIEFQDLWHLFNPGDIIVDPVNESQVYRVLSYTVSNDSSYLTPLIVIHAENGNQGGREILIDKIEPSKKPTPLDGFVVDCYNLNYNGSVYGPKLHTHSIRR